jgi:hypothetical protein
VVKAYDMTADEWLKYGWERGYCSPPVCYTHDGLPMSEEECEEFFDNDPCVHIIRMYEDQEQRRQVEADHPPTNWRASNQGWER